MTQRTVVVAGLGPAAHRLIADLRDGDPDGVWRVVAVGEEPRAAYDRVHLSSYLEEDDADALGLPTAELLDDPMVERRLGRLVAAIDRDAARVRLDDGTEIGYDALVLATGSRPFVPPVPGHDASGVHVYRTISDLDALRDAAAEGEAGVVVGGGLLGLEAANGLRLLGMTPHVLEMAPHLMAAQIDGAAGAVLADRVAALGLVVHTGTAASSIDADDGRVCSVTLTDGTVIETGLVVFCSGIRPRDELAEPAGLARGERGGVLVDAWCRTDDPAVFAVGECAAVEGRTYGLVAPGLQMASLVAAQLLGRDVDGFAPPDASTKLKLVGVDVAAFGDAHASGDDVLEVAYHRPREQAYAKVVLDAEGETLLGGVLAGDTEAYGDLRTALGRRLPASPETILGH